MIKFKFHLEENEVCELFKVLHDELDYRESEIIKQEDKSFDPGWIKWCQQDLDKFNKILERIDQGRIYE